MVTLYTQVDRNRQKTAFFLLLFSLLILALAWAVGYIFEFPGLIILAAVVVVVQGALSWWYSDKIALAVAKAKPLDKALGSAPSDRVKRLTENLCITAGLPMPAIYIIDDTALNAFATGRDQKHAALALTKGVVEQLDDNELSGVIAHELSHIGNEDIRLMSMVMVMAGLIALVSDLFLRQLWWSGDHRRREDNNTMMLIVALALAILAPVAASMIQLAISRKREFMADANAVLLTRYPEGLISALQKISADHEPLEVANRGNAHLYFANPLKKQWFASLFATHPPIEQRILALQQGTGMAH